MTHYEPRKIYMHEFEIICTEHNTYFNSTLVTVAQK